MLSILIIDDAQEDALFLERILHQCKILNPIRVLKSGAECLAYFENPEEKSEGVLVFLDLIMQPLSGIAVLKTLNERGLGKDSTFVMLSGITDIKAINAGYQLGARTFMVKPIRAEDVLELLSALKSKIEVKKEDDGYVLEWAHLNESKTEVSLADTDFFRRTISTSA
jgi:DNA-binding NtrC family response regulator